MRTFLRSTALLIALAGTSGFALHAQQTDAPMSPAQHQRHAQDPAKEAKHLSKKLALSADQTAQITPILADRQARIQALESNTSLDPKSMHQQHRAIMQDTDQKLSAVLTDSQKQLYEAMKAERHHHQDGGPMPAPTA